MQARTGDTGDPCGTPMSTLAVPIYDITRFLKTSVVKVVIDRDGNALYFSRAPIPHLRDTEEKTLWKLGERQVFGYHHLGLYAYRREFLLSYKNLPPSMLEKIEKLEQLRVLAVGRRIQVGIVEQANRGVDTTADYERFVQEYQEYRRRLSVAA